MTGTGQDERLDAVQRYLTERGIEARRDATRLHVAFRTQDTALDCVLLHREPQDQLVFYAVAPVAAPEPRRDAVARLLTRVNYGLAAGNFELDLDDGEVRYKTVADLRGNEVSEDILTSLISLNVMTVDRYLPGLHQVIDGDDPDEVAARAG